MQLYLLDFSVYLTNYYFMNSKTCNTCNVSGNQLMDNCPECGDPFANEFRPQSLRTTLSVLGLIAIASVIVL